MPRLTQQGNPNALLKWHDAQVTAYTDHPAWVVTSPNTTFVLLPWIGAVQVILCKDYRYGLADPIQWPQMFTPQFEFLAAILCQPSDRSHPYAPVWWSLEDADFQLLEGSVINCLGLLRPERIDPLCRLIQELTHAIASHPERTDPRLYWLDLAMRQAGDRLRHFPCTWRDACLQVREAQRYWLMARAFLDFWAVGSRTDVTSVPVNSRFMGAFTTDPVYVQQLFDVGIPVWWLRSDVSILQDTSVHAVVMLTQPNGLCQDRALGAEVLYSGLDGYKHIQATSRGGHTYNDISRTVLLAVRSDQGYQGPVSQKEYKTLLVTRSAAPPPGSSSAATAGKKAPRVNATKSSHPYSKPHASQTRGVNKFDPVVHEWMPQTLETWREALRSVDLSKPARPQREIWGYWIPEPGLLLRPQTVDRLHRYVFNWLRVRVAWLYVLRLREAQVSVIPTQWWWNFLYGDTGRGDPRGDTLNGQRTAEMRHVFGIAFEDAHFELDNSAPVQWFNRRMKELNVKLCPMIIWEVCELGFRHELLALDRLLVSGRDANLGEEYRDELLSHIFPDHSLYSVAELPSKGVGLSAHDPRSRAPYLDAFHRVMARWPRCPPSFLDDANPITMASGDEVIVRREHELVQFYVNTFFEQSGRTPIVPHGVPL